MPPTIAARWMTCEQPAIAWQACSTSRRSPVWTSADSRIHWGASRWSDTRTSQSASRSRRRTTAAPIVPAPPVTRTLLMVPSVYCGPRAGGFRGRSRRDERGHLGRVGEDLAGAEAVPGIDDERVSAGELADARQGAVAAELRVVGRDDDGVGALGGLLEGLRRGGDMRVVDGDVGELALQQTDDLVRERVSFVVGARLEGEAEDRDLAAGERVAEAALHTIHEEQRDALVDATHGQQHARRVGALLAEGEVLAQARPRGQARHLHAAARIVAVDEVDDLEDVRVVLLAVHHQQVGQRERRVAQDVGPDLGELGLHRARLHDRRVEAAEQLADDLAGALAHAADDARQRVDLLEELPGGDALGRVGDEDVLARLEAAVLLQIAGDELGGPRRDRRAQDE